VILQSIFDAVTPAPVSSGTVVEGTGAVIVIGTKSVGLISNVEISNTPATTSPGDAILVQDGSQVTISTVVGSGNAGVGLRVNIMSDFRRNSPTTVTGTLGDVKLGGAAIQPWSDFVAINTDLIQLCVGGPH
jgi:hypothetical protein